MKLIDVNYIRDIIYKAASLSLPFLDRVLSSRLFELPTYLRYVFFFFCLCGFIYRAFQDVHVSFYSFSFFVRFFLHTSRAKVTVYTMNGPRPELHERTLCK